MWVPGERKDLWNTISCRFIHNLNDINIVRLMFSIRWLRSCDLVQSGRRSLLFQSSRTASQASNRRVSPTDIYGVISQKNANIFHRQSCQNLGSNIQIFYDRGQSWVRETQPFILTSTSQRYARADKFQRIFYLQNTELWVWGDSERYFLSWIFQNRHSYFFFV
jgi:hypothetical protein